MKSDSMLRTLIYIPIIHTEADMGSFREAVRRLKIQKLGKKSWIHNLNLINKLWEEIGSTIADFALSYEKVRVYQDSLPVCGRESEIVTELIKAGSQNHQLLLRLKEKGATIMGTESSELLVQEYEFIRKMMTPETPARSARIEARQKALTDSLLKRRDKYIAHRINSTLQKGETGILFIGMLHSLAHWLAKDIHVVYPLFQPLDVTGRRQ